MRAVDVAVGGALTALALAIPIAFRGTLQFVIPAVGYSATLASHVPVMLSIIFGPSIAFLVGAASTVGFLATLGPVVAARAATHILFGVTSAFAVKRGLTFSKTLFTIALPLHAIPEGLVVMLFGIPFEGAIINMVGGAIHHIIDSTISITVLKAAQPLIKSFQSKIKPSKF